MSQLPQTRTQTTSSPEGGPCEETKVALSRNESAATGKTPLTHMASKLHFMCLPKLSPFHVFFPCLCCMLHHISQLFFLVPVRDRIDVGPQVIGPMLSWSSYPPFCFARDPCRSCPRRKPSFLRCLCVSSCVCLCCWSKDAISASNAGGLVQGCDGISSS